MRQAHFKFELSEFMWVQKTRECSGFSVEIGDCWSWGLEFAESENDDVGGGLASLNVVLLLHVGVDGANVGLNGSPVGHDVLGDLDLTFWSHELLLPGLQLGEVIRNILAVLQVSWDFLNEFDSVLDGSEHISQVALGKLVDNLGDIWSDGLNITEALLELWEVVLHDEAIDEAACEELDPINVHVVLHLWGRGHRSCGEET